MSVSYEACPDCHCLMIDYPNKLDCPECPFTVKKEDLCRPDDGEFDPREYLSENQTADEL